MMLSHRWTLFVASCLCSALYILLIGFPSGLYTIDAVLLSITAAPTLSIAIDFVKSKVSKKAEESNNKKPASLTYQIAFVGVLATIIVIVFVGTESPLGQILYLVAFLPIPIATVAQTELLKEAGFDLNKGSKVGNRLAILLAIVLTLSVITSLWLQST